MHDLFRDFLRQRILLSGSNIQRARCRTAVEILTKCGRFDDAFELLLEAGNIDNLLSAIEAAAPSCGDPSTISRIIEATVHISPKQLGLELLKLQTQYHSRLDIFSKARMFAEEIIARESASSRHLLSAIISIFRSIEMHAAEDQRETLTRMSILLSRLNDTDRVVGVACQAALLALQPDGCSEALLLVQDTQQRLSLLEPAACIDAQMLLAKAFYHTSDIKSALELTSAAAVTARSLGDTREIARTLDSYGLMLLQGFDPEVELIFAPLRDAVEKTGSWRYAHVSHWFPAAYYAWKGDIASAISSQKLLSEVIFSDHQKSDITSLRQLTKNLCYLLDENYDAIISDFAAMNVPRRTDAAYDILTSVAAAHSLTNRLGQSERALSRARQLREALSSFEIDGSCEALFVEIIAMCAIGKWQQARRTSERYRGRRPALAPIERALQLFCEGPPFVGVKASLQECMGRPYMGLAALLMTRVILQSSSETRELLLTSAEMEILRLIGAGKSHKDIASARSRSTETVKRQVASLFRKLGVENRTSAVAIGRERGLL